MRKVGGWVAGFPILFAFDSADKVEYSVLRDDLTFLGEAAIVR